MNRHEERRFAARYAALDLALGFVEAFCTAHAVPRVDTLRLRVMVEELFTNTIEHGHGGGADVEVELALRRDERGIELAYADPGPPFDPGAAGRPGHLDADAADRLPGGLGLHLVRELAAELDYRYDGGHNRLRLLLQLDAP